MATTKIFKSKKPPATPSPPAPPSASRSSSLSSHIAMIELKQRILTLISKLSDRDTHQIAVEDLEKIIQTLSPDGITMLLNSLYDATNDNNNKPAVKKESIRLLYYVCATHTELASTHLIKIIANIVKRLKDTDSGVKDTCRDAIGQLSCLYLKGENGVAVENTNNNNSGSVVTLFVKPLFEALNDQSKGVQAGSAMCLAKMVEMASDPPILAFQKLCVRICKYLNNPNFLAKAALLQVVSSLSQVGAISPQGLEPLLQSIHDCLTNSDWATRKAAADTLNALALHSSNLITGKTGPTITALEACRFDKIKPARDSVIEALQQWQGLSGGSEDQKPSGDDGKNAEPVKLDTRITEDPPKNDAPAGSNIPEKAVGILKKKAPALSDKELNPEFFQRLEKQVSGEVEVVVPRRLAKSFNEQNGEESSLNDTDAGSQSKESYQKVDRGIDGPSRRREFEDMSDPSQKEGFKNNNKGNWLAIQRQLTQLERQQSHLMNMLQDFMGGSHDGMLTLENRVRGLERVVEDMARDLSLSGNNRRGGNYMMGFEESGRPLGKYNGFSDYPNTKLGRNDDPISYMGPTMRGRGSSWRADGPENWDYPSYVGRNSQMGFRRGMDDRSPKSKGSGPARFGEGPSARSVWQASKDQATLEAIRVAGDENGPARTARVAVPEMTAEAMGDENVQDRRDPVWTAWTNAMDALHVDDVDTAFAEVLSTGDDLLLVKLMDRTGPVIDQLSSEVGTEVLHAVAQFLPDPNVFDICLTWLQHLLDMIVENGTDNVEVTMELKKEILVNLNEAVSTIEPPEDWEGMAPDQLLLQLVSAWEFDLHQLHK
ncbi:microtubule-associated protein TORTIFOLIA1-like [Rutidosis leptorrhynchoides]|uniref:microtubule-associated protein TORTIFOLIA1-like n=1 Tax=Rutidosis leptorrhynchoides TaxID=125765 RepID=UPI003A99EC8A